MTDLEIPAAYAEYLRDDVLRRVVDDLVPQLGGKHIPVTDRDAQKDYHLALGMAATVRAARAAFRIDAWEAIWGVQDLSGCKYDPDWVYPPSEVWDGEFGRRFAVTRPTGKVLYAALTVYCEEGGICIGFDLPDKAGSAVEPAALPGTAGWKRWRDGDAETWSLVAAEVEEADLLEPEARARWLRAAGEAAAAALATLQP